MRLIDADKLHLKLLDMEFPIQDQDVILDAMDDCAVDAAQVEHGRWIKKGQDIYCSVCGDESAYNRFGASKFSKFCQNCSAKMDLPEDGE